MPETGVHSAAPAAADLLRSQGAVAYLPRVRAMLTGERFEHVLRVVTLAREIAVANGFTAADVDRVELAALLHDAARDMDDAALLALAEPALPIEAENPLTLHGRAGRRVAEGWGVTDEAVLAAVEGHVFGVAPGDAVGAAVYVADVSEPGRGVNEDIRGLAMTDLWAAYARAVSAKVEYLRATGRTVHPQTLRAYEALGL